MSNNGLTVCLTCFLIGWLCCSDTAVGCSTSCVGMPAGIVWPDPRMPAAENITWKKSIDLNGTIGFNGAYLVPNTDDFILYGAQVLGSGPASTSRGVVLRNKMGASDWEYFLLGKNIFSVASGNSGLLIAPDGGGYWNLDQNGRVYAQVSPVMSGVGQVLALAETQGNRIVHSSSYRDCCSRTGSNASMLAVDFGTSGQWRNIESRPCVSWRSYFDQDSGLSAIVLCYQLLFFSNDGWRSHQSKAYPFPAYASLLGANVAGSMLFATYREKWTDKVGYVDIIRSDGTLAAKYRFPQLMRAVKLDPLGRPQALLDDGIALFADLSFSNWRLSLSTQGPTSLVFRANGDGVLVTSTLGTSGITSAVFITNNSGNTWQDATRTILPNAN